MRAFIGAYPDAELKQKLAEAKNQFSDFFSYLSGSEQSHIHLTVKFLGEELDGEQLQKLSQTLRPILQKRNPIKLQLAKLEFGFPGQKAPRILHVRLQSSQKLKQLNQEISLTLKTLFPQHRFTQQGFVPHITLARAKRNLSPEEIRAVRKLLKNYTFNDNLIVDKLKIMSSKFDKSGVKHHKLYQLALGHLGKL